MMLTREQQRVLALHGESFFCNSQVFSTQTSDLPSMPGQSAHISPEVAGLINRVLLRSQEDANSPRVYSQVNGLYDRQIQDIVTEALNLEESKLREFANGIIDSILGAAAERLDSLPSFCKLAETPDRGAELLRLWNSVTHVIKYIMSVIEIGRATQTRPSSLSVIVENLEHDLINDLAGLRLGLDLAANLNSSDDNLVTAGVPYFLDFAAPFLRQVVAGTKSIANGTYQIAGHDVATICIFSAVVNARRFDYSVSLNESPIYKGREVIGHIKIRVGGCGSVFVDPNALGLVLHNLIKNPIKLAKRPGNKSITELDIEIGPSTDGGCVSIFVRDDGTGVSYDQLQLYFINRARVRLAAGIQLEETEKCLLSEMWNQHVPPYALHSLILDRGASLGGGTGIGLALARQIINGGHQGYIQLYNHPKGGAGVQILLPNAGSDVSPDNRWLMTLASLRHQLGTDFR